MGHRANYVVREAGRVELFYSHWGALRVLQDLFWGEDAALAMIRASAPTEHLMDEVWCEGAALVDRDARRLLVYGAEAPGDDRVAFLELFSLTWPGWAVELAVGGIGQIAEAVGIDPAPLVHGDFLRPVALEGVFWTKPGPARCTLLTVAAAGGWFDALAAAEPLELLAAGPELLRHIADWPRVEIPASGLTELAVGGAVIVPSLGELAFWAGTETWAAERRLAPRWPGWSLRRPACEHRIHFTQTGRPLPPAPAGWAERVLADLARPDFDGAEMMRSLLPRLADGPGKIDSVQVNAEALHHPQAETPAGRKAEVIARVARHLGRGA